MPLHIELEIPQSGITYQQGKRDLFAVVIAFRYLLPEHEYIEFQQQLSVIIDRYILKTRAMSEERLLGYMGFPSNWKETAKKKK